MLKIDLFCSKPIKDICFRNDLVRHHDTYPISVKGISIKGSWSQFNLIFCCCCCLNSAINSPTYPPHSFSDASHGTSQRVCETYRFRNWP